VTREQAGLALWPDASAAQVRNTFHVLLHYVRRALAGADRDTAAPVAWVVFADGRYRLAREAAPGLTLDCDLDAVLAATDHLRRAERRREALHPGTLDGLADVLERARRGVFGEGTGAGDWAAEVEDTVRAVWAEGTQLLARQHARAGRHAAGAAALEALVAREPLREDAHRELMVLWAASGERARALAHYDAFAARLGRELRAAPASDTRALVDHLRRSA
jgi:DNA-binding SARP family transcriptional activator